MRTQTMFDLNGKSIQSLSLLLPITRKFLRTCAVLVVVFCAIFTSKQSLAFANVRICNDGEQYFKLVKVDSIESFFGQSILSTASGWYEFPSGECHTLGFDNYIWLGISTTNEHGQLGAVMLHNVTIEERVDQDRWKRISNIDLVTQYGGDAFCVHPTEDFETRTERNNFQNKCPAGYYLMPFVDETYYKGPCCGITVRELNISIPHDTPVFPYTPAQVDIFNNSIQ